MNGSPIQTLFVSVAIVAAGCLGTYLLYHAPWWLGHKADQSRYQIDGILLRILGPPISVLVAFGSVNYAL